MPGKRGIPASQLARDYGVSLNEFADDVIATLARLDGEGAAARSGGHRREICAAVTAAMSAALDASALSAAEREKLQPLLHQVLIPFWTRNCAGDADAAPFIAKRSEHYLAGRIEGSQVKTGVTIVASLLEALEVPAEKRATFAKALSPAFAHRMVGDVYHLNDVRSRLGIELSLVAALATMVHLSVSYDPILKALRIS
ncbi:MAG: hypothetical protein H7Y89_03925 [Steroidobacteraceae bacterium]|nr:hypothetical protein [Steroidobacteraceae bacterium]